MTPLYRCLVTSLSALVLLLCTTPLLNAQSLSQLSDVAERQAYFQFRPSEKSTASRPVVDPSRTAPLWQAAGMPAGTEFATVTTQVDKLTGFTRVRQQQLHQGYPVLGAEVNVHLDRDSRLIEIDGRVLTDLSTLPTRARAPGTFSAEQLNRARQAFSAQYPDIDRWKVTDLGLVWTSANPWVADAQALVLCRRLEFDDPSDHMIVEVYADVRTGKAVFSHEKVCSLRRLMYNGNEERPSNLIWEEGDALPGNLSQEQQNILQATEETYNLYKRSFGRTGTDGNDAAIYIITNASDTQCPNAFAGGDRTTYCTDTGADDVVAHELTHNYTGNLSGLIYAFESGALNESLSDVFGELLDQLNTLGNDTDEDVLRQGCGDGIRWRMGEDALAFGGAIRDMWSPECDGDPGSRSSSQYWCQEGDNGGVHINSGVPNRAFSLLVDGGQLNGTIVQSIGATKAAHIFYRAAAFYAGRVTNFEAFSYMLESAAQDLRGVNLPELTLIDLPAQASGEIITTNDVNQVLAAIAATGMRQATPCDVQPQLAPNPPAPCTETVTPEPGKRNAKMNNRAILDQDWENGLPSGWSLSQSPTNPGDWTSKPWELTAALPDNRPGQGVFVPNLATGDCQTTFDNGLSQLTSPVVTVPMDVSESLELRFTHYFSIEQDYDGGTLYMSRDGGASFSIVPKNAFIHNGYSGRLVRTSDGNDNPLAGQQAFSGSDGLSTTGTWGTSVVDLLFAGVQPGDQLQLSWAMGSDGCNGWLGWYVDEVQVIACGVAALPVEWMSFTAEATEKTIELDWETANEFDNEGFFVERLDPLTGINSFSEIGFVPAAGTENGTYAFTDVTALPNVSYTYRLRQRDFDGTEEYSDLVTAGRSSEELTVFPNPAAEWLRVVTPEAGPVTLLDAQGRVLAEQVDVQSTQFDLSGLPSGVYYVRARSLVGKVIVRK